MTRPTRTTLSLALLTTIVSLTSLACESSSADAPTAEAARQPAELAIEDEPTTHAPAIEAPAAVAAAIDDQPVLASAMTPSAREASSVAQPIAPTLERRARPSGSLRSPSLLPAGTPEINIAAFTNLPIGKRDKAPLSGVGASGIHLDELEVGKGWASSRCEELDTRFTVDVDERINVCFHVVHPREAEAVTLEWARDGEVRQIIQVNVKPTHTYSTRAWLPVTSGRVGDWTATVKSEDGSVLGQVEFEIAG